MNMKQRILNTGISAVLFTASAFAAAPGITGPSFNLTAQPAYLNQPDGSSVYSWGYGCNTPPSQSQFVGVTTAANSGVPADKAGLAAALVNASQQLGGALGLAVFTALATSHTNHLLAAHVAPVHALNSGLQRGLLASAIFLAVSAAIALRATNTRGDELESISGPLPEPALP